MLNFFIVSANATGWLLKIYAWTHLAAFVLSWIQADSRNPLVFFINKITVPVWERISRRLPIGWSSWSPYFAFILIIFAEITVPGFIRSLGAFLSGELALAGGLKNIVFYFLFGGFYIISNLIGFVSVLALIYFVFSLVGSPLNNPIVRSITFLLEPLVSPLRRVLPRARIDLSPLALAAIAFFIKVMIENFVRYIETGIVI